MQTFLPYQDFVRSAQCLDRQRLGKQRVEAKQLLRALLGETRGWARHPAALMWRGHEWWLALYGATVCEEWRARGYQDAQLPFFVAALRRLEPPANLPPWLTPRFCRAHRSNLVRKLPEHYRQFWPRVPADLPYVWPVQEVAHG